MDRGVVAPKLQGMLIELTDLALSAKQAHWNVHGPQFRPLHEQFDELAGDARNWSDQVAERLVAIGFPAHGRVDAVATLTPLPAFPAGFVEDRKAVSAVVDLLDEIIDRAEPRIEQLGGADPVSQDLFLRVTAGLEKHRWMFAAQQP
jgi:starvation-inducible DNA-binding protein